VRGKGKGKRGRGKGERVILEYFMEVRQRDASSINAWEKIERSP
jgi:hypothetical protein